MQPCPVWASDRTRNITLQLLVPLLPAVFGVIKSEACIVCIVSEAAVEESNALEVKPELVYRKSFS